MSSSPFKFLDSYTRADISSYFGRDRETDELFRRCFLSSILVVYGGSGTGKTSLVQCGLASRFQESDWLPVPVRRSGDMISSVREAIHSVTLTASNSTDLGQLAANLYLDHFKPVYFLFDQFEELFIFGAHSEAEDFFTAIGQLVAKERNARCIFIVREEYLAELTRYERIIPGLIENRYRVERLSHHHAMNVVQQLCGAHGITCTEGFAAALVERLDPESHGIELSYLQVFLDRCWRTRQGEEPFSPALLERIGHVDDMLGAFLDEQVADTPEPQRAEALLKTFVSDQGTKRQLTSSEALEWVNTIGTAMDLADVERLLQVFVTKRLLKERDERGRYELRHDALAKTIYSRISLFERDLVELKQLVASAYQAFQKRGTLITPDDLKLIAPYENRLFLSKAEHELVGRSKKDASKRLRRRLVWVSTIAAVVVLLSTALTIQARKARAAAIEQRSIAERESERAREAERAAVIAREESDRQRSEATRLKDKAIENAQQLEKAIRELQRARNAAVASEQRANQSRMAEKEQKFQAEIKSHQLEEESKRTIRALEMEKQANDDRDRISKLSQASTIAKNTLTIEDADLRGLMAVEAMTLVKENNGDLHSQEIVEALYGALRAMDLQNPWTVGGLAGEPRYMVSMQDPEQLLTMGSRGCVQHVDMKSRSLQTIVDFSSRLGPNGRAYMTSSNRAVLLFESDRELELHQLDSEGRLARGDSRPRYGEPCSFASFTDHGPFVIGHRDGQVVAYKLRRRSLREYATVQIPYGVRAIERLPNDSNFLYIVGPSTVTVVIPEASSHSIALPKGAIATKSCVDLSSSTLLIGTNDGGVLRFDPTDERFAVVAPRSGKACDALAVSPDGRWIAVVNSAGTMSVFDMSKPSDPIQFKPVEGSPRAITFGDREVLYLGYDDGMIVRVPFTPQAMSAHICQILYGHKREWQPDEWQRRIGIGEMRAPCQR